uniref:G_PROTEIN_RECEP_F1_2 domain-containing protein n=1 Tax=Panagrellus redivivus TaxID=6233 RepID=A0A7E4UTG0_PANRE
MDETANLRRGMYPEAENALKPYLLEASLTFTAGLDGITRQVCMGFLAYYVLLTIILFGTLSWFIINVSVLKRKVTVVSKTGMSLIVSSLVLGCLCFVFLFIPVGSLTFAWAFKIEDSANVVNALLVLVSLHYNIV